MTAEEGERMTILETILMPHTAEVLMRIYRDLDQGITVTKRHVTATPGGGNDRTAFLCVNRLIEAGLIDAQLIDRPMDRHDILLSATDKGRMTVAHLEAIGGME